MTARSHGRIAELEQILLDLAAQRGAGRTVDPTEVARLAAGGHPDAWGPLMPLVRTAAVRLMKEGRIMILRKGRPVDPDNFRGVYRLTVAGSDEGGEPPGAGNSASV